MAFTVGVALLVVVAVVIALAARRSRQPARDAVAVGPRVVELPVPVLPQAQSPEPVITWTVALTATALDEAARLRLIDDLTLLAAPWAIAILRRAHREESSPELRARIETALASSGETVSATI
jgi:hypothetical protein